MDFPVEAPILVLRSFRRCPGAKKTPLPEGRGVLISFHLVGRLRQRGAGLLDELLEANDKQMSFNILLGKWEYDEETGAMVPKPIKEYPLMDFRRIGNE